MLGILFRKNKNKIEPIIKKARPRCPFYGFHSTPGAYLDSQGNQCPFGGHYSPCKMETPDWDKCSGENEEAQKTKTEMIKILSKHRIFPKEFKLESQDSWKGITFGEFYEYVMDDSRCPRPKQEYAENIKK